MTELLVTLWVIISLIAIVVTVWDKCAAKIGVRRIPEAFLLWIAFLGGAAAMLMTMKLIRHKTRKAKFMVSLPLMLALHILAAGALVVWQGRLLFMPT